ARIEKLVVADMAPRAYPPQHTKIFEALLGLDLTKFRSRTEISNALAAELPDQALRFFLLKMVGRNADGSLFWQTNLHALEANSPQLRAALDGPVSFRGPTLFLRAEKSDYLRDDDLPMIRRLFPAAVVHPIAGAGHWMHVDAPESVVHELLVFLRV